MYRKEQRQNGLFPRFQCTIPGPSWRLSAYQPLSFMRHPVSLYKSNPLLAKASSSRVLLLINKSTNFTKYDNVVCKQNKILAK